MTDLMLHIHTKNLPVEVTHPEAKAIDGGIYWVMKKRSQGEDDEIRDPTNAV